jgi:nucleobase:cation symporter-1, NCS1 family
VFFIALAFALAQLGVNIAANSVSAGNDLSALMPRYVNIRRGGYIAAAVGIAMCPWKVLNSSSNFTSYLSRYFNNGSCLTVVTLSSCPVSLV